MKLILIGALLLSSPEIFATGELTGAGRKADFFKLNEKVSQEIKRILKNVESKLSKPVSLKTIEDFAGLNVNFKQYE
jgi:hypothetical protein